MPIVCPDMKMKKAVLLTGVSAEEKVLNKGIPSPASSFLPRPWILWERNFFCETVESVGEFS